MLRSLPTGADRDTDVYAKLLHSMRTKTPEWVRRVWPHFAIVGVFFFAGGWKTGTPEQFFAQCEYLAARGMVAVSAEYRIASVHQTTPREAVQDAKSALRYLRQNAGSLGLDPSRLVPVARRHTMRRRRRAGCDVR